MSSLTPRGESKGRRAVPAAVCAVVVVRLGRGRPLGSWPPRATRPSPRSRIAPPSLHFAPIDWLLAGSCRPAARVCCRDLLESRLPAPRHPATCSHTKRKAGPAVGRPALLRRRHGSRAREGGGATSAPRAHPRGCLGADTWKGGAGAGRQKALSWQSGLRAAAEGNPALGELDKAAALLRRRREGGRTGAVQNPSTRPQP